MITMNDLKSDPEALLKAELLACERVLRSGYWILGNEVLAFETKWKQYCGADYAVGCGNGMDAIEIGLRALGIGAGDEIITTPMTAFATALAIIRAGAEPVLADIDPDTAMLDVESVKRCLSLKTKAIILVNLYGQLGNVEMLAELAKQKNIYLVEDCAQSHGVKAGDKAGGTFGIFAAWSYYPTKNLGAVGDAGMLTTNDEQLAAKARQIGNYGQSERYHHPWIGMNSRLDELQAAILQERLGYLDAWTASRREVAQFYQHNINNKFVSLMPLPMNEERHVHHLYVIRSSHRDALQAHLKKQNIHSLIHYPVPIHLQKSCKGIKRDPFGLFNAEAHANTALSLPCYPTMSKNQMEKVVDAVNTFVI